MRRAMQERLLGPPPLVLDHARRRGAQRWIALQALIRNSFAFG